MSGSILAQQRFPAQASFMVQPPYTTAFADYVSTINNKLQGTVTLNDLSVPSRDVKLKLEIVGQGIRLVTNSNFVPRRITLTPGLPYRLDISQLLDYLDPAHLDFIGISRQQFIGDGRFPEGLYQFSIIALDYVTGKELSMPATAFVWLRLNDEPTVIAPQCGSVVQLNGPQNIFFQWQLNSPVNAGVPFVPNYKFYLYQIMDREKDPMYALNNGSTILIYESDPLMVTSLNYSLNMPTLDPGKRYLYRIQAFDPAGNNEFRNDGFSPPCYFYYGYPEGGKIVQKTPEKSYKMKQNDPKILEWKAPDNLLKDQSFSYHVKMIEISSLDELPEAEDFELAMPWLDAKIPPSTNSGDYAYEIKKALPNDKYFAWYLTAHTAQQTIAESEVWGFKTPSLFGFLKAGNHTVYINELKDNSLDNLTGTGMVKIYETDTDSTLTEVKFEGLKVEKVAGRYVLKSGEILSEIKDDIEFELNPRNDLNSLIYFTPKQIKLDKREMSIKGYSSYPFPHPVNGGSEAPMLTTEEGWVNFDRYKPYGELNLGNAVSVDLLEPFGFTFAFKESSQIQLFYDEYELQLDGDVLLNDKTFGVNGTRVKVPFRRAEQLYYLEEKMVQLDQEVQIIKNTKASFNSKDYVIDFSEQKSPRKMDSKEWKGIYFNEFTMVLHADLDKNKQLLLDEEWKLDVNQNSSRRTIAWIDGQGLDFEWEDDLRGEQIALFNSFPAKLDEVKLAVENSALKEGYFMGSIMVQAIDPTKDIPFKVPADQQGFKPGYLTQSLDNTTFAFNPYGGENKVDVTIKRAVFADNDHLDITADFYIPKFDLKIPNMQHFNLYGDYFIGFNKKNGAAKVSSRPSGTYDGQKFSLIEIGASLVYGSYVFSYNTEVNMGAGFQTPTLGFHSVTPAEGDVVGASQQDKGRPDIYVPQPDPDKNPKELMVDAMRITYENDQIYYTAAVEVVKNHPDLGTHYKGELEGEIKTPAKIKLGGHVIYGNEPHEFWYLDAFYVDELGVGITIYPGVNMVGVEGWVYHNMKLDGEDSTATLVRDRGTDFGFNLFGQFIDTETFGANYQLDGALKYSSKTKDIKIEGDISMINTNVRDPSATAALSQQVKQEAAQAAAKEVLEAIGGIDETISVEGVDVRVKLTESSGSLGLGSGGYEGLATVDISGTPTTQLDLSGGGVNVTMKGDVRDAASASFEGGGVLASVDYKPNSGGSFALEASGAKVDASVNPQGKSGDLLFEYESVKTSAEANLNTKKGAFTYEDGSRSLEVDADLEAKKGGFTFDTGEGVIVEMDADAQAKAGEGTIFYSGSNGDIEVGMGFNQQAGSGKFNFSDAQFTANAEASRQGTIDLTGEFEGNKIHFEGDKSEGGKFDASIEGYDVKGWMKLDGQGGLEYEDDNYHVAAEGDQKTKAGKLLFEMDDLKIAGAADPAAQTGNIDLEFDGKVVKGSFTSQEQDLLVTAEGATLKALHNADSAGLSLEKDGDFFAVGGEPANKKGFVQLRQDTNEIFMKADRLANTGTMRFAYDNIKVSAEVSPELKKASFEGEDIKLQGVLSTDSSMIDVVMQDNEFTAGLKSDGSNLLRGKIVDVTFAANTNPQEKTGDLNLNIPNHAIAASINPENGSFDYKGTDLALSAYLEKAGNGKLNFEKGDLIASLEGGQTADYNAFEFQKAEDRVFVSLDKKEKSGNLELEIGDKRTRASFNPNTQYAIAGQGSDSIRIDHLGEGAGKVALAYGEMKVNVVANPNEKKVMLNFEDPQMKLEVDAEMAAPKGSFDFERGEIAASGNYQATAQAFKAKKGEDYVRMIKNGPAVIGAVKYKSDSVAVVYQPQDLKGRVNLAYDKSFVNGAVSVKDYQAALAMDIEGFSCKFDVAIDKTNFKYVVSEGCDIDLDLGYDFDLNLPKVGLNLPAIGFNLGTLPNIPLDFRLGEFKLAFDPQFAVDINLPDFNLKLPALKSLDGFSLPKLKGLKINGLDFDPNMPGLDMSGFNLNTGLGKIGLGELAGFPLDLNLSMEGISIDFDSQLDLSFNLQGWNLKSPNVLDLNMDFGFDGSFKTMAFEIPDFAGFDINPGKIRIFDGSLDMFTISPELFSFNINGLSFDINPKLAAFKVPGSFGVGFGLEGFDFNMGDLMLAGFDINTGVKLELPEFKMNLGADLGKLNFSGLSLNLIDGYKGLSLDIDGNLLSISPELLSLDLGDYAIGLNTEKLNFKFDQDFLDLDFDGNINASLSGFELGVLPETGFDFKAPDFNMGLNLDGFYSGFGDIKLDLSMDQKLTFSGLGLHKFSMSPVSFDYGFDDISLGFELDKSLSFSGLDLDVELNPLKGVRVGYGEYSMSLGLESDLDLSLGLDKTLNIDPNLFDLKYDEISLGFGIDKNLWFDFDPYGFELTADVLSLGFDDISLGIDLNQTLQFKAPDISLDLSPKLIDFKMPDYNLGFDTKVLSFSSPDLSFNTGDLTFDLGEFNFGLTLIDDIPAIRLWDIDKFDMSLNMDRLAHLNFSDLDVKLSPDLLFDFNYNNNLKLFGNYSFVRMNWDDFDIKIGLDTLINLNMDPCKVMFLLQDPTGKIPGFQPGLYTVCDDYMVSANLGGLRFQHGIDKIKRSFTVNQTMQEFTYDEYDVDRFTGGLLFGDGYKYKLNYYRPNDKFGGGLGRIAANNDLHAEMSLPDMRILAMRTDQNNKIEGMFDKVDASVPGTINNSVIDGLDGYFKYTGSMPPQVGGQYLKDLIGISLAGETEEGEYLEESEEDMPSAGGPKYIGSISDKAGGFLLGNFELWKTSDKTMMKGKVAGQKVVEVEGAFDFMYASESDWHMYIGSRSQPVSIKALNGGPSINGYLWVNPELVELGFGSSGDFSDSWDIEVVKVGLDMGYSVNGYFIGSLDPLSIDEAGVDVAAYFKLTCELCEPTGIGDAVGIGSCTDEITLAGVKFSGSLSGNLQSGELNGRISGSATAFGIDLGTLETSAKLKMK